MYNLCGKIMAPHGIKGALKVNNYSDFARFQRGKKVYYLENGTYVELTIKSASDYKTNSLLVTFKGFEDINLTTHLLGKDLYALKSEATLAKDEYYYSDLIGKEVINEQGVIRGKVVKVKELPQGHMLVILVEGKEKMIPFRKEFVLEVNDKIIIKEIPGLL